ncbi:helix-turn-helix transcriptional regulator [Desulfoferula mesophila]|uniref:Helix-turn-helix domain-containing protein n=1 Tax=Desulfoferula mesophila TaxID=3058419 RepID=A0AAU9EJ63_9BACT|nr:hypothetical protein FAK_31060 [Desulfoferula mesophilus]
MVIDEMTPNHGSALLVTTQAATYLNMSPRTLTNFRFRGGGPRYVKLGGSVRYRREDLDSWIKAGLRESTSSMEDQLSG